MDIHGYFEIYYSVIELFVLKIKFKWVLDKCEGNLNVKIEKWERMCKYPIITVTDK